jgi:hypothetical protein
MIQFSLGSSIEKSVGDYQVNFDLVDTPSNSIQHPDATGSVIYRVPDPSLTTPPLPPLNLTAEIKFDPLLNCSPYVKLDWEHNPGNSGVITYQIFKNNALEAESLTNTKNVYGINPGTYQMSVKAMNQNNITSTDSNIVTVTVPNISSCLPNLESTTFNVVRQTSSSFVRLDFFVKANENENNIQQYKIERQLIVNGDVTYNEVQVFSNEFFQTITNDGRKVFRFHDMIEQPTTDPTVYTYRLSAQSITGFWSVIDVQSASVRPSDWMYPEYTNGSPGVLVDQFWRGPKNIQGQDYIKFQITVNESGWINSYMIEEAHSSNGPWQTILTFESDQFAWGGHSQSGNKQFQVNHFGPSQPALCYRLSYFTQGSGPVVAYTTPGSCPP